MLKTRGAVTLGPNDLKVHKSIEKFVGALRQCSSQQTENELISAELIRIRSEFSDPSSMTFISKRICLLKLLYISTLGHVLNIGVLETLNLMNSPTAGDKQIGYMVASLLYSNNLEIQRCVPVKLKADLTSQNEADLTWALSAAVNITSKDIALNLFPDVQRIANPANNYKPHLRRKAYIVLLKYFRRDASLIPPAVWAPRLAQALRTETASGCLLSLSAFLNAILEVNAKGWEMIFPFVVSCLQDAQVGKVAFDAVYYDVPCPWLQVQLLRILQYLPIPDDPSVMSILASLIRHSLNSSSPPISLARSNSVTVPSSIKTTPATPRQQKQKKNRELLNKANAEHAIFFESISLITSFGSELAPDLVHSAASSLGEFLNAKESHIRFMVLDSFAKMANNKTAKQLLEPYLGAIFKQLTEQDVTLKQQAVVLLFSLCDENNWEQITHEFIRLLSDCDESLQEDLTLKTSLIVEKYAPSFTWHLNFTLSLLSSAPDSTDSAIWERVIHVASTVNEPDGQSHIHNLVRTYKALDLKSANTYSSAVNGSAHLPEPLVCLCAYIWGEYGHLLVSKRPDKIEDAFKIFEDIFNDPSSSTEVKGIILTSSLKLAHCYSKLEQQALRLFELANKDNNVEIQQRGAEYRCILMSPLAENILATMPPFSGKILENTHLMRRMKRNVTKRAMARSELELVAATAGATIKTVNESSRLQLSRASSSSEVIGAPPSARSRKIETTKEEEETSDVDDSDEEDGRRDQEEEKKNKKKEKNKKNKKKEDTSPSRTAEGEQDLESLLPRQKDCDAKGLWKRLCILQSGLLFSSPIFSVHVNQKYENRFGRLIFSIKNEFKSPVILNFSKLSPCEFLLIREPNGPLPPELRLAPGQTHQHALDVQCTVPNNGPPPIWKILVATADGQRSGCTLPLPISPTKFISPNSLMQDEEFKKLWSGCSPATLASATAHSHFEKAKDLITILSEGFKFKCSHIVGTVCGSGWFRSSMPRPDVPTLCLIRLECDPKQKVIRLTVNSNDPQLSILLLKSIGSHIFSSPPLNIKTPSLDNNLNNNLNNNINSVPSTAASINLSPQVLNLGTPTAYPNSPPAFPQ